MECVQSLPLNSSNILINGELALDITLQGTWVVEIGAVIFGLVEWKDVYNNYVVVGMFIHANCNAVAAHCMHEHRPRVYSTRAWSHGIFHNILK